NEQERRQYDLKNQIHHPYRSRPTGWTGRHSTDSPFHCTAWDRPFSNQTQDKSADTTREAVRRWHRWNTSSHSLRSSRQQERLHSEVDQKQEQAANKYRLLALVGTIILYIYFDKQS